MKLPPITAVEALLAVLKHKWPESVLALRLYGGGNSVTVQFDDGDYLVSYSRGVGSGGIRNGMTLAETIDELLTLDTTTPLLGEEGRECGSQVIQPVTPSSPRTRTRAGGAPAPARRTSRRRHPTTI